MNDERHETRQPPTYNELPPALPDVTYFLTGELPAEHQFYDPWAVRFLWWYRQAHCPVAAYGRLSERVEWA